MWITHIKIELDKIIEAIIFEEFVLTIKNMIGKFYRILQFFFSIVIVSETQLKLYIDIYIQR